MDQSVSRTSGYAVELVRQAHRREAERVRQYEQRRRRAHEIAQALRAEYGEHLCVYLFGSLLDLERYRLDSDLDLAVIGLTPDNYWDAWARAEAFAGDVELDFVRFETAAEPLRRHIRDQGQVL
ncbi:MAG: hypothetical protein GEU90_19825 [Gemmatimonas sp.]|nr:hypothetical protein [Gemmatimonas sp.]